LKKNREILYIGRTNATQRSKNSMLDSVSEQRVDRSRVTHIHTQAWIWELPNMGKIVMKERKVLALY